MSLSSTTILYICFHIALSYFIWTKHYKRFKPLFLVLALLFGIMAILAFIMCNLFYLQECDSKYDSFFYGLISLTSALNLLFFSIKNKFKKG
ncbi:hypothetical protein ACIFOT_28935 [Neobacillus sp. NRS-1170]|uniref:hypothetical protein n=1 Tax=Neobacillus sp. NRS-1170 TaxID=3233898 RepID=UPI003D2B691F